VRERFQSFEGKEKEKKERTSGEEMRDEVEEVVEVLDEDSAMNDDDTKLSSERFGGGERWSHCSAAVDVKDGC
jgi:uncharacterized protein YcaQ